MARIILHGLLGKKFGSDWDLDVSSVSEAIHAIDVNTNGKLKAYLGKEGRNKKYKVKIGDYFIRDLDELKGRVSKSREIHIMPKSMGGSAVAKIIAGVVLFVVGFYTGGATWGPMMMMMGASLALGGVVELLTPIPKLDNNSAGNDSSTRGGYLFQGNATSQSQGGAVGLVYGRMLVSPMPISVSISNSDYYYNTGNNGGSGAWNGGSGAIPSNDPYERPDYNRNNDPFFYDSPTYDELPGNPYIDPWINELY